MKCTLSVVTQDFPGVLMRVADLFYRRNCNIESLSVSQTNQAGLSRFTIMIDADEWTHAQVEKQLSKLVEVISVENLNYRGRFVERWFALIKVRGTMETRLHIFQIADIFRCHVVDFGVDALTFEVTGDEAKIQACVEAFRPYGIIEMAGSGSVALKRSEIRAEEAFERPVHESYPRAVNA
jgi:acetolactate synthase-1/3 small subunit